MARRTRLNSLDLETVDRRPIAPGIDEVLLHTPSGTIDCEFHKARPGDAAVLWVGGAGGGLTGPAGGLYVRIAEELVPDGIASLRLDYRFPNELEDCVNDTLLGVSYLASLGRDRVVLVGHSFGGAVVITAAARTDLVAGVVTLSSQNAGTQPVTEISPRPLLLLHGTADRVLPENCSEDIYQRADEPKKLVLLDNCGHGLDQCRGQVDKNLLTWLREVLLVSV